MNFGQKQNRYHAPTTVVIGPCRHFLLAKAKDIHETRVLFATIGEIKERSKQDLLAIQKKTRFRSVSRVGKNVGISLSYLKGITLMGTT